MSDTLIQYVVVRKDLKRIGKHSPIAQGSHASVAAIATSLDSPDTQAYIKDLTNMRTVVLAVDDEAHILRLAEALTTANVAHHLWIEKIDDWQDKPDMTPTALATSPKLKSTIACHFQDLKLLL
jgi:peptidyl-tRNA hydrolase